jgi:hypothetical protein
MGWFRDEAPGHERYVVGLVQVGADGSPRWRELSRAGGDEKAPAHVERIQVECDCGWRSRVFETPLRAKWFPYVVELDDEALEDASARVWRRHVDHDLVHDKGAQGWSREGMTRRLFPARD